MKLHEKQKLIGQSPARFKVIRAGRRGGKTCFNIEDCSYRAVSKNEQHVLYIAPTQKQARSIVWEDFKRRLSPIDAKFNESRLEIKVPTAEGGSSNIYIGGWENRENYRGMRFHHVVFDELDTLKEFFVSWQEIFRPALTDTAGSATFIGTPKSESRNLQRLEKVSDEDSDYRSFHFTSYDNPHVLDSEIDKAKIELDPRTFKQEYLAEYLEDAGALFKYTALVDMFTNTITKDAEKYLIVDIADDGSDKTVFTFWEGLELYRIEKFVRLNTEGIINQIREYQAEERIPMSQTLVDAIGVGSGVANSSMLDGVVGYKSSFGAIKTDSDPTRLPNVHYTKEASLTSEYANLRSQCVFTLAQLVNDHKIACKVDDVRLKEEIIEELSHYMDASRGDGKRMPTMKDDIKTLLGRSPDLSDTLIMRCYFEIRKKLSPGQSEDAKARANKVASQFKVDNAFREANSTK